MKKENVFESDVPTLEMETQTLRQTQQGQPIPVVGGIPVNPYTGFTFNPTPAPYSPQHAYGNYNGFPMQPMPLQNVINPVVNQMPPSNGYGSNYMQPAITGGVTPGYAGTGYPTPSVANPYPGSMAMNPPVTMPAQWNGVPTAGYWNGMPTTGYWNGMPTTGNWNGTPVPAQWMGVPMTSPVQGPWANVPVTPYNSGVVNPVQPVNGYLPAINIADGQTMMVPNTYPQGATRNGNAVPKNGERDFISWIPNVNILETDRSFKIEVCVPGVTKENCQMYVDKNNVLRVSGARRWNQETDAVGFTRKDFNYGSFACSFLLPDYLQKEKITSSCRSGLLIISIPKKEVSDGEVRTSSDILIS